MLIEIIFLKHGMQPPFHKSSGTTLDSIWESRTPSSEEPTGSLHFLDQTYLVHLSCEVLVDGGSQVYSSQVY